MEMEELTQEQKLEIAKIFEDNKEHPIQILYTRLIKQAIDGLYYTLSHLPFTDSIDKKLQKIENISGRIASLEELLEMPASYAEFVKGIEEEEDKLDKK